MGYSIIRTELFLFLGGLAGLVTFQLLTGRINTAGMLRLSPGGPISPGRAQVLMATFLSAGWYLQLVLTSTSHDSMPEPPKELLAMLGGSHVGYWGGRIASFLGAFQPAKRDGTTTQQGGTT